MNLRWLSFLLVISCSTTLYAQPPFGRGGDDDDRGGRGGFFGRGGDRDDDDDDRGGRGRSFGRGGDDGGRFGGRGGRPSFGGGRGGFDPSGFLTRLDRNSNGVLDPDEQEGPAGMFIRRLQGVDSSIQPGRPVPLSKVTEAFQQMRGGRGDDDGDRGRRWGGRGGDDDDDDEGLVAETLVPGFDIEPLFDPVPGFGGIGELFAVRVTPADEQEAQERMRRYDRNRDGLLSGDEISSRWDGNPMDFDRNRDGKLSASELAVRYARRREVEETRREERRDDWRRGEEEESDEEVVDLYNGRRSYRIDHGAPEGVPIWFTERDLDGDGQVRMNEYTDKWNDSIVAEYFEFDVNGDGSITVGEVLAAVEDGASASASAPAGSSQVAARETAQDGESERPAVAMDKMPSEIDPRSREQAANIIKSNDKDGNGVLTVAEWKAMLMDISPADFDGDGRITVEEYAGHLTLRMQKLGQ